MMQLVFWHNIISPHQAPFMRSLAEAGHEVLVVTTETMSEDRRQLGWSIPSLGSANVVVNPSLAQVHEIVSLSAPDSVHFIAGARGTPLGTHVSRACREHRRRTGIITEAPDPRGMLGIARRIKYTIERFAGGRNFEFILGMGEMGVEWFQRCGYPSSRLFPFCYVTEAPAIGQTLSPLPERELLFVGRLVHLKGLDLLLLAMAVTKIGNFKLRIVGDGPLETELRKLTVELGLDDRVIWMGRQPADGIPNLMAQADVLVLPSRKDGWGAVVNESLMVGTPVICSDACGAAELIRQKWLGGVFPSGSVENLATLLQEWVERVESGISERERIRAWSKCMEGPAVAAYVEEILEHVYHTGSRPVAPWRKERP